MGLDLLKLIFQGLDKYLWAIIRISKNAFPVVEAHCQTPQQVVLCSIAQDSGTKQSPFGVK
ncbi:hypothetical protein ABHI18_003126 [Aspergillus niger]